MSVISFTFNTIPLTIFRALRIINHWMLVKSNSNLDWFFFVYYSWWETNDKTWGKWKTDKKICQACRTTLWCSHTCMLCNVEFWYTYFFNVIFSIFNKGIFNSDLKLNSDHFLHIVRTNTNLYRFQIKNLFEINSNKHKKNV